MAGKSTAKATPGHGAVAQRPRAYQLTKTKYCTGLQCLKALYLDTYQRELAAAPDAKRRQTIENGIKVGIEAHKFFPGGILIEEEREEAVKATLVAMADGAPAIFEAAFLWERVLVRVDVLRKNPDGSWDIIEVKSTTRLRDEHLSDMAIQRFVVQRSGINVSKSILKHLNNECKHPDFSNLFIDLDCTEKISQMIPGVESNLGQMRATLEASTAPTVKIGEHCSKPHDCSFKAECWKNVPEYSIFDLSGVWNSTKFDLYSKGVIQIKDIPNGTKVSRSKAQQIEAVKTGKPIVNKEAIRNFIKGLQYPLYFLDFETLNPPIPIFTGTRPYEQVPFQFSCHVKRLPDSRPTHIECLVEPPALPKETIAQKLIESLGTTGSIISYNARFEKEVISRLAESFPSMRGKLESLLVRFVDLLDVFKDHYFHPAFRGSNSIKAILPVLVPSMNYEALEVSNGIAAQVQYEKLVQGLVPNEERLRILSQLREYCGQDTLAMVEILNHLIQVQE